MSWSRICLLMLLAVAIPVQTIAAVSPQLTHREHMNVPGVQMDCHSGQSTDAPDEPSCCGDACPDMTSCAAGHVVSATSEASTATGPLTASDSRYLLPLFSSRLSSPFRPPTILCV